MAHAINREAFIALWNNHSVPTERIAQALGVTRQAVSERARRLGLPGRAKVRKLKHDPDLLREMWLAGVSSRDIAAHFGMSHHACATNAARKAGLPRRERGCSGTMNGGWKANLPISEFWERKLASRMRAVAARENATMRAAAKRAA
jgi:hypothetical protein